MKINGMNIIFKLLGHVKPLVSFMILAIILGVLGFICANFLSVLATMGVLNVIRGESIQNIVFVLLVFAFVRGFLRYGEQSCNHYIAFKLLAIIRDQVFAVLRKLAPAKLEGKDKGNLISLITSDIELLEVFYAHTISPVLIACLMSIVMMLFFGYFHPLLALYAFVSYVVVGVVIPFWVNDQSKNLGSLIRNDAGELSSFVLENLRNQKEVIQYDLFDSQIRKLMVKSDHLSSIEKKMKKIQAKNMSASGSFILILSMGMIVLSWLLSTNNLIASEDALIVSVAMFSSFSPFLALSNLSSTIQPTLAAASRVLELLEEKPLVALNVKGEEIDEMNVDVNGVSFAYADELILKDVCLKIEKNDVLGIVGKSGSGKSTLLKLLMRFWDVSQGEILFDKKAIQNIKTTSLRDNESYMTQKTHLFHDSILNNIRIARLNATRDEVEDAAKKANIHDFIMSLSNGYDTLVSECGDSLSDGEKQRIGLARAFLHDSSLMLLDEPTSNLDSLNEKIILKSLREQSEHKTVVLVSHRPSTIHWCRRIISMDQGRVS